MEGTASRSRPGPGTESVTGLFITAGYTVVGELRARHPMTILSFTENISLQAGRFSFISSILGDRGLGLDRRFFPWYCLCFNNS
jgi:hypothetical protein